MSETESSEPPLPATKYLASGDPPPEADLPRACATKTDLATVLPIPAATRDLVRVEAGPVEGRNVALLVIEHVDLAGGEASSMLIVPIHDSAHA